MPSKTRKTNKVFKFSVIEAEALGGNSTVFTAFEMEIPDGENIVIEPMDTERTMELLELLDGNGAIQVRDYRRALAAMCGDQYPRVWDLVRKRSTDVMGELVMTIAKHLTTPVTRAAVELPGGTEAS